MLTILVIEDTRELRENIAEVLTLEGFRVLEAESGTAGIQMAIEQSPDLILCDIMMPGSDGYQVLDKLKIEKRELIPPFIFISALEDRKNIRDGMELGADDYLIKPFTIDELLRAINVRLAKRKSIEQRIKMEIESIEGELQRSISDLQNQLKFQESLMDQVFAERYETTKKLYEKQDQMMQDALRTIEINSTLQEIAEQLNLALQKDNLSAEQRKILTDLRNRLRNRTILLNSQTVFQLKFDQVHPDFKSALLKYYPNLGKQDLILMCGIYMQLETFQIGVILNISAESVRKRKYRLKLKIGMDKETELNDFVLRMMDRENIA